MKLSIIIPVYNEEKNIEKVIEAVRHAPIEIDKEIIVVEDFSYDRTKHILRHKYLKFKDIKIIFHPENRGKGAAIRSGLEQVTGDIVLIQDADLEYSVEDYPTILDPLIKGEAEVVYGSRFLGKISGMRWPNWLANKILTKTVNLLYNIWITDEATAYKAFKSSLIKSIPLKCQRFEFCPEVTAKLAKRGVKIHEVPITYQGRPKVDGKKIGWRDGFKALWTLIKYRIKD
jgi:glycosyltransferase involved in cell wall biosynthesis